MQVNPCRKKILYRQCSAKKMLVSFSVYDRSDTNFSHSIPMKGAIKNKRRVEFLKLKSMFRKTIKMRERVDTREKTTKNHFMHGNLNYYTSTSCLACVKSECIVSRGTHISLRVVQKYDTTCQRGPFTFFLRLGVQVSCSR